MALSGRLSAELNVANETVVFKDHGDDVLLYAGLHVYDANGDTLEASFKLLLDKIQIRLSDKGVQYPITVDPLLTSPSWTAESDQVAAYFGYSVQQQVM